MLPKEIRDAFHMHEKDTLEIFIDRENEKITLKKAAKRCMKCQSNENLENMKNGVYLCESCIRKLQ